MTGKKLIALLLAVFLLIAGASLGIAFRLDREIKQFAPQKTGAVNADIFAVRDGMVNLYLLEKDGRYLAVDAGTDKKNIERLLKENGIDSGTVDYVLLTHTDYDHTAAVPLFKTAEVYISEHEEDMLNGKVHRMFIFNNSLKRKHELLADSETRNIGGWEVKTIILPGHTAGSAAFLIDGKYLFTGDTGIKDGTIVPFNAFFCIDQAQQRESLKKLDTLENIEITLTAHYGIIRH